jgi:hypothetical protein
MTHHCRPLALIPALLIATALIAGAQAPPAGQGRGGRGGAGQTVEKIRQLKPNLYMVTGGGANTLIRVTPDKGQSSTCAQYQAGTRTTVVGGLSRPTSFVIGPDGAIYVANKGTSMAGGEVLRFEPPAK